MVLLELKNMSSVVLSLFPLSDREIGPLEVNRKECIVHDER